MRHLLIATALTIALAGSSYALTAQQQRMSDCNVQAVGKTGSARKHFMRTCLSAKGPPTALYCAAESKPCGSACIPAGQVCHVK